MADDKFGRPIDPDISPYLQRPLRTLKEAEQDIDASAHHLVAPPPTPESPVPSSAPRFTKEPRAQSI